MKSKIVSLCLCILISTSLLFDGVRAARKSQSRTTPSSYRQEQTPAKSQETSAPAGTPSSYSANNNPSHMNEPPPAYQNSPQSYHQPPPAYNQQPGYQPAPGYGGAPGGYAPQPEKSSNTNLLQNAAIAGVGGLALYAALKPSDGETKVVYVNGTAENTTVSAAPATNTSITPSTTVVPIAELPETIFDPSSNSTVNCREVIAAHQSSTPPPGSSLTSAPAVPAVCQPYMTTLPTSPPPTSPVTQPTTQSSVKSSAFLITSSQITVLVSFILLSNEQISKLLFH